MVEWEKTEESMETQLGYHLRIYSEPHSLSLGY